jgi:hypothetical protein
MKMSNTKYGYFSERAILCIPAGANKRPGCRERFLLDAELRGFSEIVSAECAGVRFPDDDRYGGEAFDHAAVFYTRIVIPYGNAALKENGIVEIDIVKQHLRLICLHRWFTSHFDVRNKIFDKWFQNPALWVREYFMTKEGIYGKTSNILLNHSKAWVEVRET